MLHDRGMDSFDEHDIVAEGLGVNLLKEATIPDVHHGKECHGHVRTGAYKAVSCGPQSQGRAFKNLHIRCLA